MFYLVDVIYEYSAFAEALNNVSHIFQAGLQIRFRTPHAVSKSFNHRATVLTNSNRLTLVVGPFALKGIEGTSCFVRRRSSAQ